MANYNKSFNFRNGVQVDDDNFIVNANGLVGIGTSIPTEFLDVHGTAKVTGLVTARNLAITGVSTFYNDVKVGSGITLYASTGIVSATAFYGDGGNLLNVEQVAVDGWIVTAGTISTAAKVGIGTTLPYYSLQVGQDPITGNGFSIDALTGNVYSTGIVTAASRFSGNLTGNVNSTGVSTFATIQVGTGITISGGIVTATTFIGSLTGTATTATNIPNLTGAITSNNTTTSLGSFTSAQLATALSDETGSGANVFANSPTLVTPTLGSATATSIVVGGGVTINSEGVTASTGIITASRFNGTLTGNVVGIASTARDLTSDARVSISHITSQTSSIGISTVSTRLYAESIGVGTNSPSGDIHIRRNSTSTLQVTSDTAEAIVAVGRSTTLTGNNGALRFGNTSGLYPYSNTRTLDVINYGTGNLNYYLNYSAGSGNIGDFNWIYAPDATNPLMTLTYGGNLGIGVTNPTSKLQVSGNVSVSSLNVSQNIVATGAATSTSVRTLYILEGQSGLLDANGNQIISGGNQNLNITSGVSTFFNINVTNHGLFNQRIGIGNTNPLEPLHIGGDYLLTPEDAVVINSSGIGIGTTSIRFGLGIDAAEVDTVFGTVGIGTTNVDNPEGTRLLVNGPTRVVSGDVSVGINTSTGLILTSADGTKYRLFVSNTGVLSTVVVP